MAAIHHTTLLVPVKSDPVESVRYSSPSSRAQLAESFILFIGFLLFSLVFVVARLNLRIFDGHIVLISKRTHIIYGITSVSKKSIADESY